MSRRTLFTAVEERIDRGVTKAKADAARAKMHRDAVGAVDGLLARWDAERHADALDARRDAAASRRAGVADREALMGKLGALCARYAPVIKLADIARARAEIKFRKIGSAAE